MRESAESLLMIPAYSAIKSNSMARCSSPEPSNLLERSSYRPDRGLAQGRQQWMEERLAALLLVQGLQQGERLVTLRSERTHGFAVQLEWLRR
jgi:hypothetical protein